MRGFFAFGVEEPFSEELASFAKQIEGVESLILLPPSDFHVTLKFLSEFSSSIFVRTLPDLCALGPPPKNSLIVGVVALWPTVVALECECSPELRSWQLELNKLLERKGFLKERHPLYRPHITLARRRAGGRGEKDIEAWLARGGKRFEGQALPTTAPALWQSQPEGAGRRHRTYLSPLFSIQEP